MDAATQSPAEMFEQPGNNNTAWEAELIDQFAEFLKHSYFYPPNNGSVRKPLGRFLEAVERVKQVHGSRLDISLKGDAFHVAGVRVPIESPVAEWMRDAFTRTLVGVVELDATVERQSLADFAARLRVNYGDPAKNFDAFWGEGFEGIRPRQLRYEGRYDDDARLEDVLPELFQTTGKQDRVIGSLLQNDELMQKVGRLQRMLGDNLPSGESARLNLLEPIRQALPIEAVLSPKAACDLVDQILEICETKVRAMVGAETFSDQEALAVAIAGIGRRYFKATVKDMGVIPQESLPEGRPEDAGTVEDLELMMSEFEALPDGRDLRLRIDGDVHTREALGVYLHEFVNAPTDDTPAAGIVREILAAAPQHYDVLEPYVDLCLSERGVQEENRKVWRVVELLQNSDPTGILAHRTFLTPKVVQFNFPRQFAAYIDSLSLSRPEQLDQLADICRRIGAERIVAASDYLHETARIGSRRRLKKILSVDSDDLLPLVGVMARSNDNWVRDHVARFIRRRNPPVKESAALRVVRPLLWLSPQYLEALCNRNPTRAQRRWLQEESARLLRVFLRDTAGMSDLLERRIRAVHMLCALPSQENIDLLKEVIQERRFRMFRWKTRGLRRAARKARKQMKRQVHGERR